MGVFKWLRRERVTVTSLNVNNIPSDPSIPEEQIIQSTSHVGTIRTEEYKRDLAEFQARRSTGNKELNKTPTKKKCGRHSLPVSCTDCATGHDTTFDYEKKSAAKYKKNRARSNTPEKVYEPVPNIQFLFQNQVFMPGNFPATYSDPQKSKRHVRKRTSRSPEFLVQRQIDFLDDQSDSPPEFFKNNSLPFDVKSFLEGSKFEDAEEVDGMAAPGDLKTSHVTKNESGDEKLWEVMSELKHLDQWADEQLLTEYPHSKSDDSKSDVSAFGLPIASARNLDISEEKEKIWNHGKWGVVPVQIKKIKGVNIDHVKKKRNVEINILRKCRHPNIILLMGLYPDINNNVHIICERCVDSLFGVLHVQGRILSAQTSVQYALDIANALVFLRMQGYIHTQLNSMSVMITYHDTAKLADFGPCAKVNKDYEQSKVDKNYDMYSPEPVYVNIEEGDEQKTSDSEPLLSANSSETYLKSNAVAKEYDVYRYSDMYRWHAPELFEPNDGMVYPCSKSDVYSLCLILWESCNASMPWKILSYDKLKEQYTLWKTSLPLPQDGTYPGSLLSLLQSGLKVNRNERINLEQLQETLQNVKRNIDDLGYIIIPARLQNKTSNFSSVAWDTTSPTDSECFSPKNIEHKAVVHARNNQDSSDSSEKDTRSDSTPLYETIKKSFATYSVAKKCNTETESEPKYEVLQEKAFSSACSTPIAKIRARIKDITPGLLHKSDSTEYCSIFSPNRTNLAFNDDSNKDHNTPEHPTAKLSRSFTPKSYKPLHIKVPEYNLDSIKPLLKDQNGNERSSYNFDIKNYSLPSTPIARSNKLRKNAWLSGDIDSNDKQFKKTLNESIQNNEDENKQTPSPIKLQQAKSYSPETSEDNSMVDKSTDMSARSEVIRDSVTGLRKVEPPLDFLTPETDDARERTWSFKSSLDRNSLKYKVDEELLANMHVKPLVAIHERWIYEANKKSGRSMSLPEDNRKSAVKPASHCVDTLQKSLPQLNMKKSSKPFRTPPSPNSSKHGNNWEQFCQARETIARGLTFSAHGPRVRKDSDKVTSTEDRHEIMVDQSTDTQSIEEFIRDLIRKEFQHLIHEISDDTSSISNNENIMNKGIANVIESLNDPDKTLRKDSLKSFSTVKINGNNKPLLQIVFNRSGENSLHVLDNCVNVTICDNTKKDKLNQSLEDTLTEESHFSSLKRCQAFNAIQEAKSTEDLYIDDDLSTQMQENFGGKVKLIPLHGSLHEILCEKEDDCCLIKVKQENDCDTIYFNCGYPDSENDVVDGDAKDTVLYKRSISYVEERIQRVVHKDKRLQTPNKKEKIRPKSDTFIPIAKETRTKSDTFVPIAKETRHLSNSTPSLSTIDNVEVNLKNVMCYQDSSSDECIKCQEDDFEILEKKIEDDLAKVGCGLAKISEENLSVLNDGLLDW